MPHDDHGRFVSVFHKIPVPSSIFVGTDRRTAPLDGRQLQLALALLKEEQPRSLSAIAKEVWGAKSSPRVETLRQLQQALEE